MAYIQRGFSDTRLSGGSEIQKWHLHSLSYMNIHDDFYTITIVTYFKKSTSTLYRRTPAYDFRINLDPCFLSIYIYICICICISISIYMYMYCMKCIVPPVCTLHGALYNTMHFREPSCVITPPFVVDPVKYYDHFQYMRQLNTWNLIETQSNIQGKALVHEEI